MTGFPAGHTRDGAINNVIQSWGRNDPAGAGQWLATLPDDNGKQSVVQNFVNSIAYQYPGWLRRGRRL